MIELTITQKQRLTQLNGNSEVLKTQFDSVSERDIFFKDHEKQLIFKNKEKLRILLSNKNIPLTLEVEGFLTHWLTKSLNYTKVITPHIIKREALEKMTITEAHPLTEQVFWIDEKQCLRPMLAPNLYTVMKDIHKVTRERVRIFECGTCFRKESQGSKHLNEFTMLNMVEYAGVKEGQQLEKLKELSSMAMIQLGIENFDLEVTHSTVYGETLDIVVDGIEVASGAYGPHVLDEKWGIFKPWVGIGFGIERLGLLKAHYENIKCIGRSTSYIDGIKLNL